MYIKHGHCLLIHSESMFESMFLSHIGGAGATVVGVQNVDKNIYGPYTSYVNMSYTYHTFKDRVFWGI